MRRVGRGRLAGPAGARRRGRLPGHGRARRPRAAARVRRRGRGRAGRGRPLRRRVPRRCRSTVEPGPNLEARARAARYAVLPAGVLTGHTADDQAETVLLNLLRGAGLDGLAGMDPRPAGRCAACAGARPARCAPTLGLKPVEDPTNDDPAFRRNRVRHELLPLLDDIAERDVVPVLARQADLARDDVALLDELAAALDPTDARALAAAPAPLARRAVRRWLRTGGPGGDELHPPDGASVDRVLAVARGEAVACELSGGWRVARPGHACGSTARPVRRSRESVDTPVRFVAADADAIPDRRRAATATMLRRSRVPAAESGDSSIISTIPRSGRSWSGRRRSRPGSPSWAPRSPPTTPAAPRCSSACSRGRSCSWPTWPGPFACRSRSTSWPSRPTAHRPGPPASSASSRTSTST